jgi:DNA processing protein
MLATARSFALEGLNARPVTIEASVCPGISSFALVGAADGDSGRARERIRDALFNAGYEFPLGQVVVRVSPAGACPGLSALGLPIAAALLAASGQIEAVALACVPLVGRLAVDGSVMPVDGALLIIEEARAEDAEAVILPAANISETECAEDIGVYGLSHLRQLAGLCARDLPCPSCEPALAAPASAAGPSKRSHGHREPAAPSACPDCLRHAWLLALLAPYIERSAPGFGAVAEGLLSMEGRALAEHVAPKVAEQVLARLAALPEEGFAESLQAGGCWATCVHDSFYPGGLRQLAPPPPALFGRGDPSLLHDLVPDGAVTIVGARRATSYGREVARELGRELAAAGMVVVSGLAFGVDACAHRGAIDAGRTVAVLGCGPDVAYPAAHRSLWRRIGEEGLVLSELPPGAAPWRWTFPARNRIMAALAGMTVVVEAAARSGSLITADLAGALERHVGAVPGPTTSRASAGPNNMLAGGACLVRDAEDVLACMGS